MDEVVVSARQLGKRYNAFRSKPVDALVDFDLEVRRGEVFGLLGPNGAGKTTFIKVLLGIVRATSGSGQLLGKPFGDPESRLRVGYLPEQHRFPAYLTARQALDLYARLAGLTRSQRAADARKLLATVSLADWVDVKIGKFSKGMMQRLGLAQALMGDPEFIILDEPTDGVDPIGRQQIREILVRIQEQGTTVFVNSHLLSEVEMVCSRVAILSRGRLAREGTIEELTTAPASWRVRGTRVAGELPEGVELDDDGYVINAGSPEELTTRLRTLIDGGVVIREVLPAKRSLEDAFMDLVGEEGLA